MIPEGDEKAVMEALYSRGPLAISLDASHDSFRFYASGTVPPSCLLCTCTRGVTCPGCVAHKCAVNIAIVGGHVPELKLFVCCV